MLSITRNIILRAAPGIEPRTSPTLRENHTTRPTGRLLLTGNQTLMLLLTYNGNLHKANDHMGDTHRFRTVESFISLHRFEKENNFFLPM